MDFWPFRELWGLLFQIHENNEFQDSKTCCGLQVAGDRWRLQHRSCNVSTHAQTVRRPVCLLSDVPSHGCSKWSSVCINYPLASEWGRAVSYAQIPQSDGSETWWTRLMERKQRQSNQGRWVVTEYFALLTSAVRIFQLNFIIVFNIFSQISVCVLMTERIRHVSPLKPRRMTW